jgi:hypothetical protein
MVMLFESRHAGVFGEKQGILSTFRPSLRAILDDLIALQNKATN